MTKEEFDKLCKPRAEWRDFKKNPITAEEIEAALKPIREYNKRRREAERWTPEKWINLHRPMTI
jgi:hypothetical protein